MEQLEFWLPVLVVLGLTSAAFVWDVRSRRIPNFLTVPVFVLGLVYQVWIRGPEGLQEAGVAFLIGFGTLFVLWMIGGGGGGDVKLMGAISVWLGTRMVIQVLVVSVLFVWLAAVGSLVARKLKARAQSAQAQNSTETRPARHTVAFAIPVALASWLILLAHLAKSHAAG